MITEVKGKLGRMKIKKKPREEWILRNELSFISVKKELKDSENFQLET